MIGSGVVCTGLTPPGGWGGWDVKPDENDWPCRGRARSVLGGNLANRYCLIARFGEGPWFPVGLGLALVNADPPTSPAGRMPISLQFAVNRPHPEQTAAGDHQWDVVIDTYEATPTGDLPPEACAAIASQVPDIQNYARDACDRVSASNHALQDRTTAMEIAFTVAGVAAVGLTLVALPVLVAQEVASNAAERAAVNAIIAGLTEALRGIGIVGPVLAATVPPLAALATARSATTAVRSNTASPVALTPWGRIVVVALTILMIAAFAVAIGLALSLLDVGAQHDNARSDWDSTINQLRRYLDAARACHVTVDETIPTCAALGG